MRTPVASRLFWGLLLILAVSDRGGSQTYLTLEQCLELANTHSPALRAARDAIHAAELSVSEFSTTGLPQLKLVAGGRYAPLPPGLAYDPVISNGGEITGQVVLQESLFDATRNLKSDQLQLDITQRQQEHLRSERDLIVSIKESFIEALRSDREIDLQKQSVHQLEVYLDIVNRLYHGGNASYTDVLKTEVQLSNATVGLQKAVESSMIARQSLAEMIRIPVDTSVVLKGQLESIGMNDTLAPGIGDNVDLRIADIGLRRKLYDVDISNRERYPLVTVTGDAGYANSGENLHLPPSERVNGFGYSVGVGIELPIFNWGAIGLRSEQRRLEANALKAQSESLWYSLTKELARVRLQLTNARSRLRIIQTNAAKAEENFILTRSKFAGGATSSLDVLSAQQLLTDARLAELQALADIQLGLAKLEQLTGR